MATTDKQIALVEKAIQGVTVLLLAVCGFFMIRTVEQLDGLEKRMSQAETRLALLEYQNGGR